MVGNARTQRIVVRRKLRLAPRTARARGRLAGRTPPSENLVDVGHAHPKQRRGGIGAQAGVHRRHHTITQVLRIGPPIAIPRIETTTGESQINRPVNRLPIPENLKTL